MRVDCMLIVTDSEHDCRTGVYKRYNCDVKEHTQCKQCMSCNMIYHVIKEQGGQGQ